MHFQWGDIDVMDRRLDFTYDEQNFRDLPDFIENTLHANGMYYLRFFDLLVDSRGLLRTVHTTKGGNLLNQVRDLS